MDIVWKSMAGGAMTALIALAARQGNTLPGILPLFPLFGLISLALIGTRNDIEAFRETCLASAKTIPAYLVFLAACYLGIGYLNPFPVIALGILTWFAAVLFIFGV